MSDLAQLQSLMSAAIFKGHTGDISGELVAGNADPNRRFGIYRNNTFLSLTAHLKAIFPVTVRLGDERFFGYAASEFIRRHPPREARLSAYGRAFPGFLSRFPASRNAPVLAEMARLEWAIHEALTSPEQPSLDATAIGHLSELGASLRLEIQPCLRFVPARWPILGLWAGNEADAHPLSRSLTRLAVCRRGDDIAVLSLSSARFAFWRVLANGLSLETATNRALARNADFDLVGELIVLFRAGLIAGISPQINLH